VRLPFVEVVAAEAIGLMSGGLHGKRQGESG
jgi:hypothetical protein